MVLSIGELQLVEDVTLTRLPEIWLVSGGLEQPLPGKKEECLLSTLFSLGQKWESLSSFKVKIWRCKTKKTSNICFSKNIF